MKDKKVYFTKNIYYEHLFSINGVKFTRREIDVVACIANGRKGKNIASLLSIAPTTTAIHIKNIMHKLQYTSQQHIIDFIETSPDLFFIRKYYISLVFESSFKKILKELSTVKSKEKRECYILYYNDCHLRDDLLQHLKYHLKYLNVNVEVQEQILNQEVKVDNVIKLTKILVVKKEEKQRIYLKNKNIEYLDLCGYTNYYLASLEIIKSFFLDANIEASIEKFYNQVRGVSSLDEDISSWDSKKEHQPNSYQVNSTSLLENSSLKTTKKTARLLIIIGISIAIGSFFITLWSLYENISVEYKKNLRKIKEEQSIFKKTSDSYFQDLKKNKISYNNPIINVSDKKFSFSNLPSKNKDLPQSSNIDLNNSLDSDWQTQGKEYKKKIHEALHKGR